MPVEVQLGLLHGDVDLILRILQDYEDRRAADNKELGQKIGRIHWLLVTTSIALATSVIMFAANLVVA